MKHLLLVLIGIILALVGFLFINDSHPYIASTIIPTGGMLIGLNFTGMIQEIKDL